MRTFKLTPASVKEGVCEIDFLQQTSKTQNLTVGKSLIPGGYGYVQTAKLPLTAKRIYNVDGKAYYYLSDNHVYVVHGDKLSLFSEVKFATPPELFTLTYRGEKAVAVVSDGAGVIIGNGKAYINFPKGKGYLVHKGVLCCYEGDRIIFGGQYDYADYNVSVKESGFVGLENVGEILALTTDGEKLTAVCEKGICFLYTDGDRTDYRLVYSGVAVNGIARGSVKALGKKHYFVMQNALYSFDGKLTKLSLPFDLNEYQIIGSAFIHGGKYFLPVKEQEEYLLVYDLLSDDSFLTPLNGKLVYGGFYADILNKSVGTLSPENADCKWIAKPTDFNVSGEKTVYAVEVKSVGKITVTLESENGKRTIKTEGGNELFRLNLLGTEFKLSAHGGAGQFPLEKLKIYFRSSRR